MPNPKFTPGDTLPVTKDDICVSGYAGKVRNVPDSVKRKVYRLYDIASHAPGQYEVDHLVSLELGGSNEIKNLWPQSYAGQWNAHNKDKLEDYLHAKVCDGTIDLQTAQHEIATDWVAAYRKYFGDTAH
ncbi:MAG: HNH endonuclease [Acidobacteria bacterium]|nr:HNH endonuclease [Acidobacteriota bacterium]